MADPGEIAERALAAKQIPDPLASGFDEWTPAAIDAGVPGLAAVLLLRKTGRAKWFSFTAVCAHVGDDWHSLDEVGNGDDWKPDPHTRPKGGGFVWSTSTFGGEYQGRYILSTAGVLGHDAAVLTVSSSEGERDVLVRPISGAFVVLVRGRSQENVPRYQLIAINRDGSDETIAYDPPSDITDARRGARPPDTG